MVDPTRDRSVQGAGRLVLSVDGRLASKTGGRWEMDSQNGGKFEIGPTNRWEMGGGPATPPTRNEGQGFKCYQLAELLGVARENDKFS